MSPPELVVIDGRVHRAWPFLPAALPVGAVVVGPSGEVVRVLGDGSAAEVLPPGHPHGGLAYDPMNARPGLRAG